MANGLDIQGMMDDVRSRDLARWQQAEDAENDLIHRTQTATAKGNAERARIEAAARAGMIPASAARNNAGPHVVAGLQALEGLINPEALAQKPI